jgi:hypothetical protein
MLRAAHPRGLWNSAITSARATWVTAPKQFATVTAVEETFVVSAIDLDDDEYGEANAEVPMADVAWPDGRVDMLPHTCTSVDIDAEEILGEHPLLHLGYQNLLAGMTSGYDSADMSRLSVDVFYSRIGDILGGEWVSYYLRGKFELLVQRWLDEILDSNSDSWTPWDSLDPLCTL